MARPLNSKVLNLFRQFFGGQKLSLNFQRNNIGIVSDIFQNPFAFFITDSVFYSFTCVIRSLFVCHFNDFQLTVTA